MEEDLIIGVWDTFKGYMPEKNRETAATHYVDFLIGQDISIKVLESVMGFDPHLDSAIKLVLDEFNEEDEIDDHDTYYEDEE